MKFVRISPVLALILAIILASGVALAWTVFSGTLGSVRIGIKVAQASVKKIDITIDGVKSGHEFAKSVSVEDAINITNARELIVIFSITNLDEFEFEMFQNLTCDVVIYDDQRNIVGQVSFNIIPGNDTGPKAVTLLEGSYNVIINIYGVAGYPQPTSDNIAEADFSIDVVVETPSY